MELLLGSPMPFLLEIKRPVRPTLDQPAVLLKRMSALATGSNAVSFAIGTAHRDFSTIPIHAPLEAATSPLQKDDDASGRLTLDELWKAVVATNIGSKLLGKVPKKPKLRWGSTVNGFHGEWDGKAIILNDAERNQLSDNEWKQVITLELGNASNDATFQQIFEQSEINPPSREDFVDSIEKVEFETRLAVIAAYNAGEFCNPGEKTCKAVFDTSVTDFDVYRKDPRGLLHRESYGRVWDENFRPIYNKRHPEGK